MSGHTPGPWGIRTYNYGDHRDAEGIFPVGQVINLVPCVYGRTLEQCDANAKLIAAAPELLAACRAALALLSDSDAEPTDADAVTVTVRAALAKAGAL